MRGSTTTRGGFGAVASLVLVIVSGCGDSGGDEPPRSGGHSSRTSLVVTKPDGSTVQVVPSKVTCGPGEYEHGVQVVQVRAFTKAYYFQVEVVPADVAGGKTLKLPINSGDGESGPKNALVFFSTDPGIEASTDEEEGTGNVRVDRASCDPVALDLTIDATLGSELSDVDGVKIKGHLALGD